ncbi:pentapeptide repeat-containing protein [Streptomyces sp. NBC_01565]|uniref:pentapeptide repeat-containing protein n=1 Tax=Streptomyces sp. NBC_01565 TaxID=2975881 RepID=UPI002259C860|nr:pentapeptide repeat-containing protein [Streptomyces sp. NBC_01565]MCX4546710.1 pentapeptide repeat-containing protein [Streptomyces sp. NBC_01565]
MWPVWVAGLLALLVTLFAGYGIYKILHSLVSKEATPENPVAVHEVIRSVLATLTLAGAVLAGIYAYRKQRLAESDADRADEKQLAERYTTAADQLGHDQAAVRLAGVYAMARLADDWIEQRQVCIDVLCAYLRMPYEPDPEAGAYKDGEREVRHTVIRVISNHLQRRAPISWAACDFDFTRATFDGGTLRGSGFQGTVDFSGAKFSGGMVDFSATEFSGGTVSFRDAVFSGGTVSFGGAWFSGGTADFSATVFSGSTVDFSYAEFRGDTGDFSGAKFSGGTVHFGGAKFSGGTIEFTGVEFSGGTVHFGGAKFSGSTVHFNNAEFSGGTIDFFDAGFSGGRIDFFGVEFSGSTVSFGGARFSGGAIEFFSGVEFSGGTVHFGGAEFSGSTIDFRDAVFSGSTISFGGAEFSGGTVSFGGAVFSGGAVDFEGVSGAPQDWGPFQPRTDSGG